MKKTNLFYLAMLAASLFFVGCNDDDDTDPGSDNEEEEITTVVLTFVDQSSNSSSFRYKIEDEMITEQETIMLNANETYTATVEFLNEEESPAEDVTLEIMAEDDEHLVCYVVTNSGTAVATTDTDGNGLELGLATMWTTGAASTGTLTLSLKHQPDIKAAPVDCNAGETDIEAEFPVTIQ